MSDYFSKFNVPNPVLFVDVRRPIFDGYSTCNSAANIMSKTLTEAQVTTANARSRLGLRTKLATRPMMLLRFSPAGEGRLEEGDDEEGARLKSLCIGSDGGGFAIRRRRLSVASRRFVCSSLRTVKQR